MKKIIDVSSIEDESFALTLIYRVQAEQPAQPVGNGGAIPIRTRGTNFLVIRNKDSYTVREVTKNDLNNFVNQNV